jgi:hypothetical protein
MEMIKPRGRGRKPRGAGSQHKLKHVRLTPDGAVAPNLSGGMPGYNSSVACSQICRTRLPAGIGLAIAAD